MKLYVDRNLDGTNCIFVVPDCISTEDFIDEKNEIATDNIPYIDLNMIGFDSNYDHFIKNK